MDQAVLIYISVAFDSISHSLLLNRLEAISILDYMYYAPLTQLLYTLITECALL